MRPLGVGVVGCGGAAADLASAIDALPDDLRVVAAHDRDAARAARLATARGARVHPELDALLADPAVDIVYIGLPHHLLAPAAQRALLAGRHALVEKPVALAVEEVRALSTAARRGGLVLGAMLELRAHAATRAARGLLTRGVVGEVRAVRIRTIIDKPAAYWRAQWRGARSEAGGGVVLMNCIHQIDLVAYLTGLRFTRASAEVATLAADVEVEDTAAAALRLSNGAVVSLTAAAHSPGARREEFIEIDGSLGRLDLPDPYGPGHVRLFLRRDVEGVAPAGWHDVAVSEGDCYIEMLRDYATAVRTGRAPAATAEDAAAALATVLAIYRSAADGCAVDIADPR